MKQFSPNKKTMKNVHMSCLGFSPKNDARVKELSDILTRSVQIENYKVSKLY